MFSVVIPLYNKSGHIVKAINSVLNQTFEILELIVINDGSTDDGPDKVKEFADKRIRLINQANAGVSTARNTGVNLSRYEYIAFLDADDWWDIHFLEEMKGLVETHADAALYGSNFYIVKSGINRESTIGLDKSFKSGYIDYCRVYASTFCVPINCSFVVLPKSIFLAEKGFNEQLSFGEDFDLWIRIALKHKVAYVNKALAYSNQDAETDSRALGLNKFYPMESFFIFNLSQIEPFEKENEQLKKLMDGLRVRSLFRYYLNRKYLNEVKDVLLKVDFTRQPLYYRLIYSVPLPIVKMYFKIKIIGSNIKNKLSK